MPNPVDQLADLIARRFIARTDVKAIQYPTGAYSPIHEKWARENLRDHLNGTRTFGHYLLNSNSQCKLFCFDVDIKKTNPDQNVYWPLPSEFDEDGWPTNFSLGRDARAEWLDRRSPCRTWFKRSMHLIAHELALGIQTTLKIPTAVAYTGNKGIHVYGFTGTIDAYAARQGAEIVLDSLEKFEQRNGVFWQYADKDPHTSFPQFDIEVFPKQDSLDGKDLGNLIRLPLGVNQKSPKEPTFFVDMSAALNTLSPVDSVFALGTDNVFRMPGE